MIFLLQVFRKIHTCSNSHQLRTYTSARQTEGWIKNNSKNYNARQYP